MNILISGSFHLPALEESSLLPADSAFPYLILNLPNDKVSTTGFVNLIIKQERKLNLMKYSVILT